MKTRASASVKAVSVMTSIAFLSAACSGSGPGLAPLPAKVKVELSIRTPASDGGSTWTRLGENPLTTAEYERLRRPVAVGGALTDDPAAFIGAGQLTVPLRSGGQLEIRRSANLLEVVGVTDDITSQRSGGKPDAPSAARLTGGGLALYQAGASTTGEADMNLVLHGLEEQPEQREALAITLAITMLAAAYEDQQHFDPVTWAIIASVLGGAWLAICGGTAVYCMNKCEKKDGFKVGCGGVSVTVKNSVKVTVSPAFECRCVN